MASFVLRAYLLLILVGLVFGCNDEGKEEVAERIGDPSIALDIEARHYYTDSTEVVTSDSGDTLGYRQASSAIKRAYITFFRRDGGEEELILKTRTNENGLASCTVIGYGLVILRLNSNQLGEHMDSVRVRKGVQNFFEFKVEE